MVEGARGRWGWKGRQKHHHLGHRRTNLEAGFYVKYKIIENNFTATEVPKRGGVEAEETTPVILMRDDADCKVTLNW